MKTKATSRIERETMMIWNGDGLADTLIGFGLAAKVIISLMVLALLFLIIFQGGHPRVDTFLAQSLELIIGGFLAILILTSGIVMGTGRFAVYGVWMLLLSVLCRVQFISFPYVFILSGGVAFLGGSTILIRFIRNNPVVPAAPMEDINVT